MEHVKPIIPRTKTAKSIIGREFPCRNCGAAARVTLEENTYYLVTCYACGDKARLKEYHR